MKIQELSQAIIDNHQRFIDYLQSLSKDEFEYSPEGKWSAGMQLQHIILSVKPLNTGMKMPHLVLKTMFGKANRPSRTYNEVIAKYQSKLDEGGKASKEYIPKAVQYEEKDQLIDSLQNEVQKLAKYINKKDEKSMDTLLLPHPLIGKMTMREMIYFTMYHVLAHIEIIKKQLNSRIE